MLAKQARCRPPCAAATHGQAAEYNRGREACGGGDAGGSARAEMSAGLSPLSRSARGPGHGTRVASRQRHGCYGSGPRKGYASETGVLRRELSDRRPVEQLATMGEQREKAIAQQARQRHGDTKGLRRGNGEANILL